MTREPYLDNQILHSTFMIAKHTVLPMDLVAVDTCTGKRIYSFLAVAWGIIADVDIESEKYRSLGNSRFALGAFVRIIGEILKSSMNILVHNIVIEYCISNRPIYGEHSNIYRYISQTSGLIRSVTNLCNVLDDSSGDISPHGNLMTRWLDGQLSATCIKFSTSRASNFELCSAKKLEDHASFDHRLTICWGTPDLRRVPT